MSCFGKSNSGDDEVLLNPDEDDGLTNDLSKWMTNLPEKLTKIPINKLAIPGSHDCGSYYLDPDSLYESKHAH